MARAHIIEVSNGNGWGWATTFCGRTGERWVDNWFLSPSGKTLFQAFRTDDTAHLSGHIRCQACRCAYDAAMAAREAA